MSTEWKEKNVGFISKKGKVEKQMVKDERDGTSSGYHLVHWDGKQDAVVQPKTIQLKVRRGE
jgi:hypothetical protein